MAEKRAKAARKAARNAERLSNSVQNDAKRILTNRKLIAPCAAVCLGTAPLAAQAHVVLDVTPQFTMPIASDTLKYGFGVDAKLEMKPKSYLGFFAEGSYQTISLNAEGLDNLDVLNGSLGIAFHHSFTDALQLNADALVGAYRASGLSNTISGMSGGVRLGLTYRINPVIGATASAGYTHLANSPSDLLHGATAAAGISLDLTEAFNHEASAKAEVTSVAPVFPVLYSWYEKNSFGKVKVTNNEEGSVTDVRVYFYLPQYMTQENECLHLNKVGRGESFESDLTAFFNERMLELTEKTDTQALIKVTYRFLGQQREREFPVTIPVYNRNSMSWDDDRRAAVFVSSKDPAALLFSKYIASVVRDRLRYGVNQNIQYVMGLFETLHTFGINYVVDPSSAYADNVGSTSIDFLQFPYQTLMYRGGDCDDLSILNCSLVEAIGIESAFITVPGHIFVAFDSGMTEAEARRVSSDLSEYIIMKGKVWIPLEITLTKDSFEKAWKVGAREWRAASAQGKANLYPMHDSWKIYKPVSVPGAVANFTLPDRTEIAMQFDNSIDSWVQNQISPLVNGYRIELARGEKPVVRNELGVLYGSYGLLDEAGEQFTVARRAQYVPAIVNLGNVQFNSQNYSKALEMYKSALRYEPDDPIALLGASRSLYEMDEFAESDKYYRKVCEKNPALASQYGYLGSFSNTSGRSYSFADRLATTTWSDPENEKRLAQKIVAESAPVSQKITDVAVPAPAAPVVTPAAPAAEATAPAVTTAAPAAEASAPVAEATAPAAEAAAPVVTPAVPAAEATAPAVTTAAPAAEAAAPVVTAPVAVATAPAASSSSASASSSDDSAFASAADDATAGWSVAPTASAAVSGNEMAVAPATSASVPENQTAVVPVQGNGTAVTAVQGNQTPAAAVPVAPVEPFEPVGLANEIASYTPEKLQSSSDDASSEKTSDGADSSASGLSAESSSSVSESSSSGSETPSSDIENEILSETYVTPYAAESLDSLKIVAPDGSVTKKSVDTVLNPLGDSFTVAEPKTKKTEVAMSPAVQKGDIDSLPELKTVSVPQSETSEPQVSEKTDKVKEENIQSQENKFSLSKDKNLLVKGDESQSKETSASEPREIQPVVQGEEPSVKGRKSVFAVVIAAAAAVIAACAGAVIINRKKRSGK